MTDAPRDNNGNGHDHDHDHSHGPDHAHAHDHGDAHGHDHPHAQDHDSTPDEPNHPLVQGLASAVRLLKFGGLLAVLLVAVSGVTVIKPDEVALRLRFGRLTGQTAADQVHPPGLLISFPYLVDEIVRVPGPKRVLELRVDALKAKSALAFDGVDITRDGYAITGDNNLVQPEVLVKYQIVDPVRWALRANDPETVVHDAVVSALTRSITEIGVDEVLTSGKRALTQIAKRRAQARLDESGTWVRLTAIEFSSLQPPAQVARFFDDVQKAVTEVKTQEQMERGRELHDAPSPSSSNWGSPSRRWTCARSPPTSASESLRTTSVTTSPARSLPTPPMPRFSSRRSTTRTASGSRSRTRSATTSSGITSRRAATFMSIEGTTSACGDGARPKVSIRRRSRRTGSQLPS